MVSHEHLQTVVGKLQSLINLTDRGCFKNRSRISTFSMPKYRKSSTSPFGAYCGGQMTTIQPRASLTLYGADDEVTSEANDLVIGSAQKQPRSPVSPFPRRSMDQADPYSSRQLMEQFQEIYQELQMRLNKGISLGKELKLEQKLRESSNSFIGVHKSTDVTGDLLDLKAEITSLKNKLFMADQTRREELS